MKTFRVIDIIGNFDLLIGKEIKADTMEDANKIAIEIVKEHINEYLYSVVDEVEEI